MEFNWKQLVGTVAPALGVALGGPVGGIAAKAIADALGLSSSDEESISQAMQKATPADLLALKKADQDFATKMKELDIDLEKAFLGDRDSARKREMAVQDKAVPRLAALVVAGFIGMCGVVLTGTVQVNDVLAGTVIGYVSGACTQVLAYYFGTTKGSNDKNAIIAGQVLK